MTHNCLNGGCILLINLFNRMKMIGNSRVVAMVEKFYDILERIHSLESGHVGYKKTLACRSICFMCLCCN